MAYSNLVTYFTIIGLVEIIVAVILPLYTLILLGLATIWLASMFYKWEQKLNEEFLLLAEKNGQLEVRISKLEAKLQDLKALEE